MVALLAAQARHARLRARADRRFESAKARHAAEVVHAARLEADAWHALLAIPGVTPATAAALLEVSEATVIKWARVPRTTTTSAPPSARSDTATTEPVQEHFGGMG